MAKQSALKRFVALLGFYFTASFCVAQSPTDSAKFFMVNLGEGTDIGLKTEIFVDSVAGFSFTDVLKLPFTPLESFTQKKKIHRNLVSSTFYLKLHFGNSSTVPVSGYFFPGINYSKIDVYKLGVGVEKLTNTGNVSGYRKLTIGAGEETDYLVVLKMIKNDFNTIDPQFIQSSYFDKYQKHNTGFKNDIQVYGLILSGIVLMMILFMISNYIISKKTEFLYNALYSASIFMLMLLNAILLRTSTNFTNFYYSYFDFFLLVIGSVFYLEFLRKFLNTESNHQQLDKFLKYSFQFVLLLLGVYSVLHFFTSSYLPQYYLENVMKIFMLIIGIIFIILALKKQDRLFNYIAAGNTALIFFSIISLLFIFLNPSNHSFLNSSVVHYNTGVVIELAFFLVGLTYKNRRELIVGIQQQEALKQDAEKQEYETQIAIIKAQQEVKNRISADMHDDLGAGMTTISLYSELAKKKLGDNQIPEIEKITSSANELLNKMNAIIWSMSSSNDSLNNMIAYIRSYAIEYFEDTGIKCKINLPENLPNVIVNGEIRRNVFLVVKEALNNILKHSKATEVNIDLIRVEDGLTLTIQDDGVGINFEKIRQFGNGLKNMRKRMADFGIDFNIENKNGTLITLHRTIAAFNFS